MVHAVGCIDGHHHADAFLPDDGVGVESDPHQSEGEEREGEAPQDQDDEILDLDLTRTRQGPCGEAPLPPSLSGGGVSGREGE